MPCFYNSPSFIATAKPENIPFTEAELGSHILRTCPIQWQDQYNSHEKGMTPMDLRLLLMSLEAIECVCAQEKATESSEKASTKGENGKKQPGTKPKARVPKKACTNKKHCNLCKKHGGTHTTHNTRYCHKNDMGGKEKADFHAIKKSGKKPNSAGQNFAQLSKKLDKLEKILKKARKNSKTRQYKGSDSDSE
jgi:hypothetical protein